MLSMYTSASRNYHNNHASTNESVPTTCSLAWYPDLIGCDKFDTVWEWKHRLGFRVKDQSLVRCQILELRGENPTMRLDNQSARVPGKYGQEILRIDPDNRARRFNGLSHGRGRRRSCSRSSTSTCQFGSS